MLKWYQKYKRKSKAGKWLHGVSIKLKTELTVIKKYCYWRKREHSGGISLTNLWSEFCLVSLLFSTKSRTLTLLECAGRVKLEPRIWPRCPWVLVAKVDRAPARCLGGHRFESCRGLRLFLCPMFVTCWGGSIPQSHLLFLNLPQLKIFLSTLKKNGLQKQWYITFLQWNLINTITKGPKKFGYINRVVILTRVFSQENVRRFLPGGQNKVAIIKRWPYYRGGWKVWFHCTISHLCNPNQIHSRHNYGPGLALDV